VSAHRVDVAQVEGAYTEWVRGRNLDEMPPPLFPPLDIPFWSGSVTTASNVTIGSTVTGDANFIAAAFFQTWNGTSV